MTVKPFDIFDRDEEWADLAQFATSPLPGLRIAIVYGRRRQGKSYLLRRLAEAAGGIYHLATEQVESISLSRFADSLASWHGVPAGAFGFDGWESALNTAAELMAARTRTAPTGSAPALLVIDEFPYLAHESPGLASIVQGLYDRIGPGATASAPALKLILCGSAISVMSGLLSGTKAMRGRGALELRIKPFGFRDARAFWGIEDPEAAFRHNAFIGGTPGYRELTPDPHFPESVPQVGAWLARNVLRPSVPLFSEAERVVHEDPRIRDSAAYGSILAAVAAGESAPTKIGALLGRPATSLAYQLGMLEAAGFIERRQDLLLERRPVITVTDPIVRLHHLVIEPFLADLEAGRAERVWTEVGHTVESKILGPHFEALVLEWTARYARDEAGLEAGVVGQSVISCREHKTSHEIDVLALARGVRPRTAGAPVVFLAEAKARDRRPSLAALRRLEHLRDLLTAAGHDAGGASLGLFSTSGFSPDLVTEAARSGRRVLLFGLDEIYAGP